MNNKDLEFELIIHTLEHLYHLEEIMVSSMTDQMSNDKWAVYVSMFSKVNSSIALYESLHDDFSEYFKDELSFKLIDGVKIK